MVDEKKGNDGTGLERIIARIEQDSQRKIASMDKAATVKIDEMKAHSTKELTARLTALDEEHEKGLEKERNKILSEARLSARRTVLSAKEEVLEEVADDVFEKLSVSGSKGYKQFLITYLTKAKKMVGEGGKVKCREQDALDMKLAVSKSGISATLDFGLSRDEAGFLAFSKDGSSFVDMRLETVLDAAFKESRKEMLEVLFSDKGRDDSAVNKAGEGVASMENKNTEG